MISRLEKILKKEIEITDFDKRFYTHEIREYERYKSMGYENLKKEDLSIEIWENVYYNTHAATLEDYKIYEKMEYNGNTIFALYHPDVQK